MATPANPDVLLVDGSSYLYRAFHALPPLTNSNGEPTGALYGVVNMLRKLLKDFSPQYIAVVFDPKGKTTRDSIYPTYKANRPPMPPDLGAQIEPLFAIIRAMGLPLIIIDGIEADDVIGTLAAIAHKIGLTTLISTGDKDFAQLVNSHITLINTMNNAVYDIPGVKEKFGLLPERIVDYLTLVGDSVDNIPGVPKVGPKTAIKWLEEYGSLEQLVANAEKISGKVGENLRESLTQLPLTQQLVTIACDIELPFHFEQLKAQAPNQDKLIELFTRLEFKSWLTELLVQSEQPQNSKQYRILLNKEDFLTWIKRLKEAKQFAFDTKTINLDYMQAEIVGISFSINANEAVYVPVAHDYLGAPLQLSREEVFDELKPLLEDPEIKKIGHDLKYDANVWANYGITLKGLAYDIMLEAFILANGSRNDLDSLAVKYLHHKNISLEEIAGIGAKQLAFNQIPVEIAGSYAAQGADITLQLHQQLWPKIVNDSKLNHIFCDIEMSLVPILSNIERTGVLIDAAMLNTQSAQLAKRLEILEKQAHKLAECVFNLGSPQQLQEILYQRMGLPILQKTPKGQPSTAEEVLQELALNFPLPKVILEYRSLSKLKSTYTDKLPLQINSRTTRVHTSYHQVGAATGRFSSSDPNLQNIPIRTEEGKRIRQAFIAPPQHKIIAADYSQIELRIMAHLSKDEGLLNAFAQGLDVHLATAAEIFDLPLEKVDELHRRHAKAINFGLIYGMSAFGLAKQLDIERNAASRYMDVYFQRYPGVKQYMEVIRQQAHKTGYVETLFGRKFYIPEINSQNQQRKKAAERAAINAPMQGTAADIIKNAMVRIATLLEEKQLPARIIMQVHDELVFEVHESAVDICIPLIRDAMVGAIELSVPLTVGIGVGNNWDEAH